TAGEPAVDALREARIDLACLLVRIVVEKDDVEVGGVAELLAAELAVGDDRETRLIRAMPARELAPGALDDELEHPVGERGKMVREPLDGEQARQVLRKQP